MTIQNSLLQVALLTPAGMTNTGTEPLPLVMAAFKRSLHHNPVCADLCDFLPEGHWSEVPGQFKLSESPRCFLRVHFHCTRYRTYGTVPLSLFHWLPVEAQTQKLQYLKYQTCWVLIWYFGTLGLDLLSLSTCCAYSLPLNTMSWHK